MVERHLATAEPTKKLINSKVTFLSLFLGAAFDAAAMADADDDVVDDVDELRSSSKQQFIILISLSSSSKLNFTFFISPAQDNLLRSPEAHFWDK